MDPALKVGARCHLATVPRARGSAEAADTRAPGSHLFAGIRQTEPPLERVSGAPPCKELIDWSVGA